MSWENGQVWIEPADAYHGRDELSATKTKDFIASRRGYFRRHVLKVDKSEPTATMDLGSAVHEEVLLEAMERSYEVIPEEVLSKSGSKAGGAWKEYQAANAGRLLLKAGEVDKITNMLRSVSAHPLARDLLAQKGMRFREVTLTATALCHVAQSNGEILERSIGLRSRIDYLGNSIVDLKTTGDLSPKAMKWRPWDLGWNIQGQFYRKMVHALTGEWMDIDFVVVENKEPYRVEVWTPSMRTLNEADAIIDEAIPALVNCQQAWLETKDENVWQREGFDARNEF